MLAWRSFLRRHDPLTSCLRPVRRHDSTQAAVLFCRNLTASRGYTVRDPKNGDSHQPPAMKRHLYLVLDDHEKSYGIYKIDVDTDLHDGLGSKASDLAPARRLPQPPVIRLDVPGEDPVFVAEGGCIIGKGCFPSYMDEDDDGITVVYNIKTATLSISIRRSGLPKNPLHDFTLACRARLWGCSPPFFPCNIQAYAVHPLEGTIFVSGLPEEEDIDDDVVNTFSYDARIAKWTRLGRSALPFKGEPVYDGELDAWLGFHADDEGDRTGHLVACRVPSREQDWPPHSQVIGEKMIFQDPGWRLVDAKLVHMVERGQYCLIQRLWRDGTNEKKRLRNGDECLLRLTTFRVGVEHYGLGITECRTRSYKVVRYRQEFEVRAFWI